MTLYEMLGVHETAPAEVIEASWKALMKKFHPDGSTPDLELTQKINAAHDILADENKRKAYDAQLRAERESERFKPENFPGFREPQGYPPAYPAAYPTPLDQVIQNAATRIAEVAFESIFDQMPPAIQHGIKNAMRYGRKRRAS